MASRNVSGAKPPGPSTREHPPHLIFRSGGEGFLLTRRKPTEPWAKLADTHARSTGEVLRRATREDMALLGRLRSTFAHDIQPLGQKGSPADTLPAIALLVERHRLYLCRLGEATPRPSGDMRKLRIDHAPTPAPRADADDAPAPRDLAEKLHIVFSAMLDKAYVPPRELGTDAAIFIATLGAAGIIGRLATVVAAWLAAHLTPAGWAIDLAMFGFGVWAVGYGIVDTLRELLEIAGDIQGAATRRDLKRQALPLAKVLIHGGITAVLSFFLKGLDKRKKGNGVSRQAEGEAAAPASTRQARAEPAASAATTKPAAATAPARKTGSLSAEEANRPHIEAGNRPPYAAGTSARDIVLDKDRVFARVHGDGNQARSWMMRAEDIKGLTPQQIKDKFALPDLPKYVSDVHVPAGTPIRVGEVGAQQGWGAGGGTQYELLKRLPEAAFKNRRPL